MKKTKIICALPKYSFGDKSRDFSTEYQSFFPEIKKKFQNTVFFNTVDKNRSIDEINNNFKKICLKFRPNYIFMSLSGYEIYIETLVYLKKNLNTILLNWCSDDIWRFEEHSKLYARFFDYSITTNQKAYGKYKSYNLSAILSNWGCPDKWLNKPKNFYKCKYDTSFIGSAYMGRDKIVKRLTNDGFNVKCYGFGWKNKPVKSNKFSEILNNSKVCLNFSKSRKNVLQTKARIFEITGSGSLCLTENSNDIKNFFSNKKELIIFNNYKDLKTKLSAVLKKSKLRDQITWGGYKKCKKNYLYSKIIDQVLKKIDRNKDSIKTIKINYKNYLFTFYIFFIFLKVLSKIFSWIFNKKKTEKIFRRISFELEWRIRSELVYSKKGWSLKLYGII